MSRINTSELEVLKGLLARLNEDAPAAPRPDDGPRFVDLWLHFKRYNRVGKTTFDGYESLWRTHVQEAFGGKSVALIGQKDIETFRVEKKEAGYPASTRNRMVNVVRTLIKHGMRNGLITVSPILDSDKEPEDNVREVVLGEETIGAVLEYLEGDYYLRHGDDATVFGAFFLLCIDSGLRREEACRVKWEHANFDSHTLYVSWVAAKLKLARTTVLFDRAIEWLRRIPRVSDYIFVNRETGKTYRPDFYEKAWQEIRSRLHIEHVHIHDLRRSFVTLCRRRGIPETVVMKLSGHRSHEVFRRYAIVGPEDFDSAIERFEKGRLREVAALNAEKRKRKT